MQFNIASSRLVQVLREFICERARVCVRGKTKFVAMATRADAACHRVSVCSAWLPDSCA